MENEGNTQGTGRLWTPWRMTYIGGETKESGCIFCNRLQGSHDVESLILYRARHAFVIMNLYPYNTGHIMLVPNQHASDPAGLSPETLAEMGMLLPTLTTALRRAFGCQGFNVGLNIGAIAGAGVEAHLHEHIVPRWQGDANFMPILANTMTIPELIPVTYAKIRAELTRELTHATRARLVLLDESDASVLLHDGELPAVNLDPAVPVLQAAIASLPAGLNPVRLTGWAGPNSASPVHEDDIILTLAGTATVDPAPPWSLARVDDMPEPTIADAVSRAIAQRAPGL